MTEVFTMGSENVRAKNWFDKEEDFLTVINEAEGNVKNEWETDFVSAIEGNAKKYGLETFLSDAQYDRLVSISER